MGGKLNLLQQPRKKELHVTIDHHYASKVYTTGSPITGVVTFTPRKDTPFESVRVSLVGQARVRRDDLDLPKVATHWFLRADMADSELAYPGSKVFRARETYTVPFHFIVPDHLTPSACRHGVDAEGVRGSHTLLPPSMGSWEKDDMTVATSRVEYGIQAEIVVPSSKKGSNITTKHIINVLPYAPEEPPLNITPMNIQYRMNVDKKVRKSVISPADGRLRAAASQPRAISLDSSGKESSESAVYISLDFTSKSPSHRPPKIGAVSATLEAQTWSRQSPAVTYPNMSFLRDAYTNYTTILSRAAVEASWTAEVKREADASATYSAALCIPFSLPMDKRMWIPSFHNCLISRTYRLDLSFDVGNTTLRFNLPLQIAMETLEFPLEADVDGWVPEELGMEGDWPQWGGTYSYGDSNLRAVGGDVLPDYYA